MRKRVARLLMGGVKLILEIERTERNLRGKETVRDGVRHGKLEPILLFLLRLIPAEIIVI
jgi:hypothetical protein